MKKREVSDMKGLTLVEVMATVAVTALVIAFLLMPHFQKESRRAKASMCIVNLKIIDRVKTMWALREGKLLEDEPAWEDLVPEYLQKTPACPLGGTYTIGNVSKKPTCTVEGHRLP